MSDIPVIPRVSECCDAPIEQESYHDNKKYDVCTLCGMAFCKTKTAKLNADEEEAMRLLKEEAAMRLKSSSKWHVVGGSSGSIGVMGGTGVVRLTASTMPASGFASMTDEESYPVAAPTPHTEINFQTMIEDISFTVDINPRNGNLNIVATSPMRTKKALEIQQEKLFSRPNMLEAIQRDMVKSLHYADKNGSPKKEPFWKRGKSGKSVPSPF